MKEEKVLCVKVADLAEIPLPAAGFLIKYQNKVIDIIIEKGLFVNRKEAENNNVYKQIIPYCLLRRGKKTFVTERLQGGNEVRLHGWFSLGIGGHINPESKREIITADTIELSILKEFYEEIKFKKEGFHKYEISDCKGIINNNKDSVGKVHIGLLYEIRLKKKTKIEVKETEKLTGVWLKDKRLRYLYKPEFEAWSQIILESYLI